MVNEPLKAIQGADLLNMSNTALPNHIFAVSCSHTLTHQWNSHRELFDPIDPLYLLSHSHKRKDISTATIHYFSVTVYKCIHTF